MDATTQLQRGLNFFDAGEFERAAESFARVIALRGDFADAYTGRGYSYYWLGKFEQAFKDFTEAIRCNSQDFDAWCGRADSRQILGDFLGAIDDYNAVIRIVPLHGYALRRRGNAHDTLGDIPAAISDYRQALIADPEQVVARYQLAALLAQTREYQDAIHHYEVAVGDEDLDSFVYAGFAWCLSVCPDGKLRNTTKAIEMATIACDCCGWSEDDALASLAAAYAGNADFSSAQHWQQQAIDSAENFGDVSRLAIQQARFRWYEMELAPSAPGFPGVDLIPR